MTDATEALNSFLFTSVALPYGRSSVLTARRSSMAR
jgi:hypothetical protein